MAGAKPITPETILSFDGMIPQGQQREKQITRCQVAVGRIAAGAGISISMPGPRHFYFFHDRRSFATAKRQLAGDSELSEGYTHQGQSLVLINRNDGTTMQTVTRELVHSTAQRSKKSSGKPLSVTHSAWNEMGVQMLTIQTMHRLGYGGYNPVLASLVAVGNELLPEMATRAWRNINATGLLYEMIYRDVLTGNDESVRLLKETHGNLVVDIWKRHDKRGDRAKDIDLANLLGLTHAVEVIQQIPERGRVDERLLMSRWQ